MLLYVFVLLFSVKPIRVSHVISCQVSSFLSLYELKFLSLCSSSTTPANMLCRKNYITLLCRAAGTSWRFAFLRLSPSHPASEAANKSCWSHTVEST